MNKQMTTGVTLLVVVAIIFVLNYLVGGLGFGNFRWDVTEEKLYTLSQGTKNILGRISPDKPVTIRYYATTDDRVMPPQLKPFTRTLEDLLLEYEKAGNNKIVLEKIAPNPNTEEEDKATEDEINGQQVNMEGDKIYLGLAIQSGKQKEVLPFINPREESQLEYNISRAINKVTSAGTKVVGVMSSMPIQGSPQMPWMRQQGQQQQPWAIVSSLRQDYEVREVPFTTENIDSDIGLLVVVHPANITEQTEFAIDQYVMKGGKVIAFMDPMSLMSQQYSNQPPNPMMGQQAPTMINQTSEMKNLFKAWGVGFTDQVVADMSFRNAIFGRVNPTSMTLPADVINKVDPITAQLQSVMMLGAGAFKVDKTDGVSSVTLIESSENSELIDTTAAEKLRREALMSFNPSGTKKALAVRLTGKFKSAFPNGRPAAPGDGAPKENGGAQDDANAPKAADDKAAAAPASPAPAVTSPPVSAPVTTPPAAPAAQPPAPKGQDAVPTVTPTSEPPPAAVSAPAAPTPAAPADAAKAGEAAKAEKKPDSLKESTGEPMVLLFSDSDMMFDGIAMAQDQMGGGMLNSNMALFFNAVEVLTGGGDLLSVRSRASTHRPFKKLDQMKSELEAQFRPQLQALDTKLQSTAQEISTLKLKRDQKSGTIFIDPADVKKLEDLQAAQTDVNKKIRELKKEQNKKIDKTETLITVANVLGMPLIVICIGILLAIKRRSSTAAR